MSRERTPSLNSFYDVEEKRLQARLEGVRLAISHAGEKGCVLENEVTAFIRGILPIEYGVATGFIAYCENGEVGLSPQLDIIIYDAIRCCPLVAFETCSIFPLEAIYAYIEIKAALDSSNLSECIAKNIKMRKLRERGFWYPETGSPPETALYTDQWLSIRSFLFSFESRLGTGRELAQKLQDRLTESAEAHIHGVFVAGEGFFSPHRIAGKKDVFADEQKEFSFTKTHALTAFKVLLVKCLATFRRFSTELSPAVDRYHFGFVELSEGTSHNTSYKT